MNALNVKVLTHSDQAINQTLDQWINQCIIIHIPKIAVYLAKDQTIAQSVSKSNNQASYRPLT